MMQSLSLRNVAPGAWAPGFFKEACDEMGEQSFLGSVGLRPGFKKVSDHFEK